MNKILLLAFLVSCNPLFKLKELDPRIGENGPNAQSALHPGIWNFSSAGNYTYDTNYISVTAGKATLRQVDQTHDSASDFANGTHIGTEFSGAALTLNETLSNIVVLDNSWTPQHANIVGYWRLNETAPSSGSTITAQIGADGTLSTDNGVSSKEGEGIIDKGLSLDGTLDYVQIGDLAALRPSSVTFSAWVKFSDLSPLEQFLGGFGDSGLKGYWLGFAGGFLRFSAADGTNLIQLSSTIAGNINQWYHLVGTHEAGSTKIYVDGVEKNTDSSVVGNLDYTGVPAGFRLGNIQGNNASRFLRGTIDEVAVWNTVLSEDEIFLIYHRQKSKFLGIYNSPIMDLGVSGPWTNIDWVTSLPFGKELPGSSGNELSTDYASLVDSSGTSGNSDLHTGLVGLWHFNEKTAGTLPGVTDFQDSSLNSNYGTASNSPTLGAAGIFSSSVEFDASSEGVIIPDDSVFDITDTISVSVWIYPKAETLTYDRFVEKDFATSWYFGSGAGPNDLSVWINNGRRAFSATNIVPVNQWSHALFTFDKDAGGADEIKIYLNGIQVASGDYSTAIGIDNADISIARNLSTLSRSFTGKIDELAIWNRVLDPNEVLELYRRGANRVKYQVRSCDDAVCAGDSWIGPDGTAASYFSELHNCTSINGANGECNGNVQIGKPSLTFSEFVSAPNPEQYFQYRAILESDDEIGVCAGSTTCMPSVSSIEVGPTGRYFAGSPSIVNNIPAIFSSLFAFSETTLGTCTPTYQVSNDNLTFYYWNGANWAPGASAAQSSNAADVNANISSFVADVASGNLYWRTYLNSDGSQACEIDELIFDL